MASLRITNLPSPPGLSRNPSGNRNAAAAAAAAQRRGVALSDLKAKLLEREHHTADQAIAARDAEIAHLRAENERLRAETAGLRDFASQHSRLVNKLWKADQELTVKGLQIQELRVKASSLRKEIVEGEVVAREGAEGDKEWYATATQMHDRALAAERKSKEAVGKVEELEREIARLSAVNGMGAVGEGRERWW